MGWAALCAHAARTRMAWPVLPETPGTGREAGARPRNRGRRLRLDSPFVPDDRFPSLSCHKAQHSECQLWVAYGPSRPVSHGAAM